MIRINASAGPRGLAAIQLNAIVEELWARGGLPGQHQQQIQIISKPPRRPMTDGDKMKFAISRGRWPTEDEQAGYYQS
jgi:hypothetical protein